MPSPQFTAAIHQDCRTIAPRARQIQHVPPPAVLGSSSLCAATEKWPEPSTVNARKCLAGPSPADPGRRASGGSRSRPPPVRGALRAPGSDPACPSAGADRGRRRRHISSWSGVRVVRAPVGALLLLREVDAEQFLAQILETVSVGEGPHQFRRDLGAIDRRAIDIEIDLERAQIEAREMEQLEDLRVLEQRLEVGSGCALAGGAAWRSAPDGICRRPGSTAPGTNGRARDCRPMVSVSTATTGPSFRPAGRSPRCSSMVIQRA